MEPRTKQGAYEPGNVEPKWQAYWEEHRTFHVGNPRDPDFDSRKPKYYVLDMFPYTSGAGLHVGHPEGYTATDILARYRRMCGFNVLHPIGWDSFGLPAEQHAITTGVHPRVTTEKAIERFRAQLKRFGFSYDWDRELATTEPKYYKWTQWIFLQMFNSWFDPIAEGKCEDGRPYRGMARPIDTLVAELSAGRLRVDERYDIVAAGAAKASNRHWLDLSQPEQRRVIDHQRLAFMDEVPVNWCPMLGTVLANEEVTNDGRSERGDFPVFRRPLKQWMLRITSYCDRLIQDIETVDWPEAIKAQQRNWVGRSVGTEAVFSLARPVVGCDDHIRIFTTRPDTLFGATYVVLAPEHPLVEACLPHDPERRAAVTAYVQEACARSEVDRAVETRDKTGVFTGSYAINPVNDRQIPVWVADYVLLGYGTGAIMAVPAHDTRDFEFALKFGLPIVPVVRPPAEWLGAHVQIPRDAGAAAIECLLQDTGGRDYSQAVDAAYTGEGTAINSGAFDGLPSGEFKERITRWLADHDRGRAAVNYKLRDWLFSRQRYWGEPFPILHAADGALVPLADHELPLDLPHMEDFKPDASEDPDAAPVPPLGKATQWACVRRDGALLKRELNTMPQWAGSCWYYLRYLDPQNAHAPWDREAEAYWMNVDQYVGGAEHAVLHLLYARFWHKVLYDLGHVSTIEPFQRLYNQGLILSHAYKDQRGMTLAVDQVEARDGRFYHKDTEEEVEQIVAKMSKTLLNVVNPDEILDEFGADTFRLYEMYMGPLDSAKPWNTRDIPGLKRFLQRVWRLMVDQETGALSPAVQNLMPDDALQRRLHKLIRKVTQDIEAFKFNTAIAELIAFTNDLTAQKVRPRAVLEVLVLLLSPLAPHIAEELWERLGHPHTLAYEPWPRFDPALARDERIEIPVQVNGKVRGRITVPADAGEEAIRSAALADEQVRRIIGTQQPRKVIVRATIVNVVVGQPGRSG